MQKGQLESVTQQFVDELAAQGGKPLYQLTPAEARQVLEELQARPVEKLPAVIEDHTLPGGPNGPVSVRIVRPASAGGTLPVVMYFHGGGWILGSKNTHDRLIREVANGTGAAVVFVNYTPSPEAHYPVSIEEAYAATKHIAEHGADLHLDGSRLVVFGDSVGGNMVAAVTLLAKQRGGPKIARQVMCYPVTNADFTTGSYQQFADGPWLTKAAMQWFWEAYAPEQEMREQITASPLRATEQELAGLPPALLMVDENDVLRDEGEAYAHKLLAAGVEVTSVRHLGTIHDFMLLNPLSKTPAVRSAIQLANLYVTQALFPAQATPEELRKAA